MKQFFKRHIEQTLAAVALIFLAIIAAYFIWGITTISLDVSQVTNSNTQEASSTVFDIKGAQSLNLKGLIQQ